MKIESPDVVSMEDDAVVEADGKFPDFQDPISDEDFRIDSRRDVKKLITIEF